VTQDEDQLPVSVRVLLQQCRLGKGDVYGRQLMAELNKDGDAGHQAEVFGISQEVLSYYELASRHRVTSALERWRRRSDEADAEIVFNDRHYLEDQLSLRELHAIWYDCAAKMAREMLQQAKESNDPCKIDQLLFRLKLLTLDIRAETGRPFPYADVIQGWPTTPTEETLRVHIVGTYRHLSAIIGYTKLPDGGGRQLPLDVVEDFLERVFLLHAKEQWGISLEELDMSPETIRELALKNVEAGKRDA
jgi:hypothetical protein